MRAPEQRRRLRPAAVGSTTHEDTTIHRRGRELCAIGRKAARTQHHASVKRLPRAVRAVAAQQLQAHRARHRDGALSRGGGRVWRTERHDIHAARLSLQCRLPAKQGPHLPVRP